MMDNLEPARSVLAAGHTPSARHKEGNFNDFIRAARQAAGALRLAPARRSLAQKDSQAPLVAGQTVTSCQAGP